MNHLQYSMRSPKKNFNLFQSVRLSRRISLSMIMVQGMQTLVSKTGIIVKVIYPPMRMNLIKQTNQKRRRIRGKGREVIKLVLCRPSLTSKLKRRHLNLYRYPFVKKAHVNCYRCRTTGKDLFRH